MHPFPHAAISPWGHFPLEPALGISLFDICCHRLSFAHFGVSLLCTGLQAAGTQPQAKVQATTSTSAAAQPATSSPTIPAGVWLCSNTVADVTSPPKSSPGRPTLTQLCRHTIEQHAQGHCVAAARIEADGAAPLRHGPCLNRRAPGIALEAQRCAGDASTH